MLQVHTITKHGIFVQNLVDGTTCCGPPLMNHCKSSVKKKNLCNIDSCKILSYSHCQLSTFSQ